MDTSETVTKIFSGNDDSIPLKIQVPIRVPIEDFETENIKIVNCYTTGESITYLLREIEYGLGNIIFAHYRG